MALALDATTLGARFVVLAVSVLYRGCAIPVAWTVVRGGEKGAWNPHWLRMLRRLKPSIPTPMPVLVLPDRGLFSASLFRRIRRMKWHPFMRIKAGGTFRPNAGGYFRPLRSFAPKPGTAWKGQGTAFKPTPLPCTLLARWEEGAKEPWLILTELPPEACEACWYGLRAWIEHGFQLVKRGGWQWPRTRMTDPRRAARLWLAVAVAPLWLGSVGGEADETIPVSTCLDLTGLLNASRQRKATQLRVVSVFRRGWCLLLVALLHATALPLGALIPEPWPKGPPLEEEAQGSSQPLRQTGT